MMKLTKRDKRTNLEKEIDEVIAQMAEVDPSSQEYTTMVKNLEVLYKAKATEPKKKVSPDTLAVVTGNLVGIGWILKHEELKVISTKALSFVLKGRV